MIKGQTTIGIVTAFGGIALFLIGWLSWTSVKVISVSEQTASVLEWQENTDKNLKEYQDSTDETLEKVSGDITQLKIDMATSKELLRVLSLRFEINPDTIEQRVIREVEKENVDSDSLSTNSKGTI